MKYKHFKAWCCLFSAVLGATGMLTGCGGFLPRSGPSTSKVRQATNNQQITGIQILDVTDGVARKLLASQKKTLFSETLGSHSHIGYQVGPGDIVEVSVWEAPPA